MNKKNASALFVAALMIISSVAILSTNFGLDNNGGGGGLITRRWAPAPALL